MSRKGDRWDNAPMESFFHSLRTERIHHRVYATRTGARRNLFGYIESFYNSRRLHSALATSAQPKPSGERPNPSTFPGGCLQMARLVRLRRAKFVWWLKAQRNRALAPLANLQ